MAATEAEPGAACRSGLQLFGAGRRVIGFQLGVLSKVADGALAKIHLLLQNPPDVGQGGLAALAARLALDDERTEPGRRRLRPTVTPAPARVDAGGSSFVVRR